MKESDFKDLEDKHREELERLEEELKKIGDRITTYIGTPIREENLKALANFTLKYNLDKPTTGRVCINRLKGKKCRFGYRDHNSSDCHIPHKDHTSLWLKDGDPEVYIAHLYPFGEKTARDIANFSEEKDLDITFWSGLSFWNYGQTIAVIVREGGSDDKGRGT